MESPVNSNPIMDALNSPTPIVRVPTAEVIAKRLPQNHNLLTTLLNMRDELELDHGFAQRKTSIDNTPKNLEYLRSVTDKLNEIKGHIKDTETMIAYLNDQNAQILAGADSGTKETKA